MQRNRKLLLAFAAMLGLLGFFGYDAWRYAKAYSAWERRIAESDRLMNNRVFEQLRERHQRYEAERKGERDL